MNINQRALAGIARCHAHALSQPSTRFCQGPSCSQHVQRAWHTRHERQNRIPAAYYRGGTSRALLFLQKDLPASKDDWQSIFLGTIGSPDPNGRQLDGMGGGISSLSKICVVGPSKRPDAQVEFTFVQVGVKNDGIDYAGNCGNMSSAIGPFAVDSGLIRPSVSREGKSETTTVSLYNTNTQKIIHATFPVTSDGSETVYDGDFAIDGVAGTAAKIQLDFVDPGGSKTGKLLPTGNVVDTIDGVEVTCIDAGNPCVFVRAADLGVDGTMLPQETEARPDLLSKLELLRAKAAVAMGMATTVEDVPASIPKICFVSKPVEHQLLSGETLATDSVDVVVRAISTGQPHKALPITCGLSVSAAARLNGSLVQQCLSGAAAQKTEVVVGHPSGQLVVDAVYDDPAKQLARATVYRTARRLMEGAVFWK
jgi:2-methylaconitate cis-trans-isomerase PrpF